MNNQTTQCKLVTVSVSWHGLNTEKKEDRTDRKLYQKSIRGYIEMFNTLPPKGLMISTGKCDPGRIDKIFFNGIDKGVFVYLSFD